MCLARCVFRLGERVVGFRGRLRVCGVDGILSAGKEVVGGDVAEGAVKPLGVVQVGNTRPVVRSRAKSFTPGTLGSLRQPGRTGRL